MTSVPLLALLARAGLDPDLLGAEGAPGEGAEAEGFAALLAAAVAMGDTMPGHAPSGGHAPADGDAAPADGDLPPAGDLPSDAAALPDGYALPAEVEAALAELAGPFHPGGGGVERPRKEGEVSARPFHPGGGGVERPRTGGEEPVVDGTAWPVRLVPVEPQPATSPTAPEPTAPEPTASEPIAPTPPSTTTSAPTPTSTLVSIPEAADGIVSADVAVAAEASPVPAAARAEGSLHGRIVGRVLDALDHLRNAPPPRHVTVEVPDADGLRLQVALRGQEVHVQVHGTTPPDVAGWIRDLGAGLSARGLSLGAFGTDTGTAEGGRDGGTTNQGQGRDRDHPDPRPRHAPDRTDDDALRL